MKIRLRDRLLCAWRGHRWQARASDFKPGIPIFCWRCGTCAPWYPWDFFPPSAEARSRDAAAAAGPR